MLIQLRIFHRSTCAPESDVTSADLESDRCDSPGDLLLGRDPEVTPLPPPHHHHHHPVNVSPFLPAGLGHRLREVRRFPTAPERSRSPPSRIRLNVTRRLGAERGFLAELRREQ
ncbi:hypothetical protein INR49_018320 [Caranx melampygus]|nr:hypothetical protein INR49_018320 [Caranx melampygus]